jgi:aryl-alcohol dehydrogenase-like predicted oxidoreductase
MGFGDGDNGRNPWALGEIDAEPIFRRAVELGITLWDTANVYSNGTSEEIVGRAIRRYTRREDVVIATKVGPPNARRSRRIPASPAGRFWSRSTRR